MIMIMSVFDHCVGLALKELKEIWAKILILNRVSFVVPQKKPSVSTGVFKTLSNN